eukprot:TRINITY_DN5883_c0_g1_i3.p1 TRINITY_DN5883_c0_g1~~TRINITY_DN5883_c0_g1_i3.p1  ORF type:complete len:255 (+),score=14.42 TRINITY_DN5883_c0_g1_i3:106-765(+)
MFALTKKRFHLLELHDCEWFPSQMRELMLDVLRLSWKVGLWQSNLSVAAPILVSAMKEMGSNNVVDLCSGSGGPWFELQPYIKNKYGTHIKVRLSDLYPNESLSSRSQINDDVTYIQTPVDATKIHLIKESKNSFLTMFTALHHFKPDQVRAILQSVVDNNQGIAIFEPQNRSLYTMFCVVPLIAYLAMVAPLMFPFSWKRLFYTFTYMIPFVLVFDGI